MSSTLWQLPELRGGGGGGASFFLRSDGVAEQTKTDGLVCSSIAGNDNRSVYISGENAGNVQHTDNTGAQVAGIVAGGLIASLILRS